jgi:hypothetical protein
MMFEWLSPNKPFLPSREGNTAQDISMLKIPEKLSAPPMEAKTQLVF